MTAMTPDPPEYASVHADIVALLEAARAAAARTVNALMTPPTGRSADASSNLSKVDRNAPSTAKP